MNLHRVSPPEFIRGGRLRKTSKGLISFAPFLVGASVLALGALLATSSPVQAGSCSLQGNPSAANGHNVLCSGAADSANDRTETIQSSIAGAALEITDDGTFGLDVSSGRGLAVTGGEEGTSVTVNVNGDIRANNQAVYVKQEGTGAVSVTTGGTITSSAMRGIDIITAAGTTGDVTVTANGGITTQATGPSGTGIFVDQNGTGKVSVTTSGEINAGGDSGIYVITESATTGDVEITVNDDVIGRTGIGATNSGTGNVIINVNAVVSATTSSAIVTAGRGDHRIIFGDGGNIGSGDGIQITASSGTATLEFAGTGSGNRFTFENNKINGIDEIVKSGSGTWTFDGFQSTNSTQTIAVNSGRLVLDIDNTGGEDTFFFTNTSPGVTVADGAVLEVASPLVLDSYVTGGGTGEDVTLTLSGVLELTGTSSSLTLDALEGTGGEVNIDVDFSGGDADLSAPRLIVTSATGSTAVNIRSVGGFPEIPEGEEDEESRTVSIGNLIQVTGTATASAFVPGRALNRGFRVANLVHDDSSGENVWMVVVEATRDGSGTIEQALYESLPAVLTQFASLQSYQQRRQGRRHDGGVWARVSNVSAGFEPISTSLATYEIKDSVAEFGVDVPLRAEHAGNFTVGANVAFGDATAEIAVPGSTGEIKTGVFKAAISANWEFDGPYVDGQLQYAVFNNDVKADEKLDSTNATAYSGGLEVGYGMDLGNLRVAPLARLLWASVDFEDFTGPAGTEIVLDDGVVVTGIAGVGVEYDWNGALFQGISSADILLRGRAGVLVPVDGDVNTRVGGMEFISERKEPAFDAGLGATYVWNGYALSADVSTRQGEEVEGYTGNVGFKYKF